MNSTQEHREQLDAGDAGGIVVGWLSKLVVVAAIIGVLGFDGISVGLGHLSTTDDGGNAAQAASQSYESAHNLQKAYNAAVAVINGHEHILSTDFVIDADGTAHLTITNTVHTLVLYRLSQTKKLAVITERVSGKYTGS